MDIRKVVGQNIKDARIAASMSQEELAARMDVDQGYISSLEAGKRNPTILTIWHASVALGVQTDALFKCDTATHTSKRQSRSKLRSKAG
ncbi:MAG: helix-turn-helix transcriptional regulator [Alphaproteobacteria bacterium]|nr:helix-turn-helix transcriptional regulator [Alphaproteobacteria bacterium]